MERNIYTDINQWLSGETGDSFENLSMYHDPVTLISTLSDHFSDRYSEIVDKILEKPIHVSSSIKTIAIHCESLANGGIQRVVAQLLRIFDSELPYRLILISDEQPSPDEYPVPASVVRYVLGKGNCSRERLTRLHTILSKEKADLFWDHIYYNPDLLYYILLCRTMSIPYVLHHHNVFSNQWARGSFQTEKLFSAYRLCTMILVLSPFDQTFFNLLGFPALYIPNPPSFQFKHRLAYDPDANKILWAGRIANNKQPLDAIRIFAQVHKKHPDLKLTIVGGNGAPELMRQMDRLITDLQLEDHIERPGFQKDMLPYYKQASLTLITSQFEGFSMILVESKSCGIPVLLYDMPNLTLAGEHDGTIRVRQGDINGAAKKICDFFSSREKRCRLSEEAAESYDRYASFDLLQSYRSVFEKISNPDGETHLPQTVEPETVRMILQTFLFHTFLGNRILLEDFLKMTEEYDFYKEKTFSAEYVLGRVLLLIPRKVIGFFVCLKENGCKYTFKRIINFFRKEQ